MFISEGVAIVAAVTILSSAAAASGRGLASPPSTTAAEVLRRAIISSTRSSRTRVMHPRSLSVSSAPSVPPPPLAGGGGGIPRIERAKSALQHGFRPAARQLASEPFAATLYSTARSSRYAGEDDANGWWDAAAAGKI